MEYSKFKEMLVASDGEELKCPDCGARRRGFGNSSGFAMLNCSECGRSDLLSDDPGDKALFDQMVGILSEGED